MISSKYKIKRGEGPLKNLKLEGHIHAYTYPYSRKNLIEISLDCPFYLLFHTTVGHSREAYGVLCRYHPGEHIEANCTAERTKPPTNLTWYINQELVSILPTMAALVHIMAETIHVRYRN